MAPWPIARFGRILDQLSKKNTLIVFNSLFFLYNILCWKNYEKKTYNSIVLLYLYVILYTLIKKWIYIS